MNINVVTKSNMTKTEAYRTGSQSILSIMNIHIFSTHIQSLAMLCSAVAEKL